MKMNEAANKHTQGSFGIPPEMKEAAEKHKTKAEPKQRPPQEELKQETPDAPSESKDVKVKTPLDVLQGMGADFTEEDFSRLIFKGNYETTIDVIKGRLTAKFRTLSTREHDEIDEIITTELKDTPMTEDGLRSRTSLLIISYGVTELQGKPLTKQILDGKTIDTKAMALARRAVFLEMAPAVINILINKHGAITVAMSMIASEPEDNLKNS